MAKIDISKMNLKDLKTLQVDVERAIEQREVQDKIYLKEKMTAMAEKAGFSIDEVFGKSKGKRATVTPKYRNPDNVSQTWSGRGRRPVWVQELLDAGKNLEEILI